MLQIFDSVLTTITIDCFSILEIFKTFGSTKFEIELLTRNCDTIYSYRRIKEYRNYRYLRKQFPIAKIDIDNNRCRYLSKVPDNTAATRADVEVQYNLKTNVNNSL